MLFKATILAVFSLLAAQGAMAIPTTAPGEVGIMIATDPCESTAL